ncbi:MAG TPA: hypothetical protein VE197_04000 [Mycobacterium sp.]|nr:hypothetical protein [Mycobacterium sp.]
MPDVVFVVALIALVGVTVGFALACRADGVDGTGVRRWRGSSGALRILTRNCCAPCRQGINGGVRGGFGVNSGPEVRVTRIW